MVWRTSLLEAAVKLADHLLEGSPGCGPEKEGWKDYSQAHGRESPDYYERIAAMRKTRRGDRPLKEKS